MICILIADDHTIMREGLKRILDGIEDIQVIGEGLADTTPSPKCEN